MTTKIFGANYKVLLDFRQIFQNPKSANEDSGSWLRSFESIANCDQLLHDELIMQRALLSQAARSSQAFVVGGRRAYYAARSALHVWFLSWSIMVFTTERPHI